MTENELYHHGVKGMHWGIRRYQNKDGTLTEAGQRRLDKYKDKQSVKSDAKWDKEINKSLKQAAKYKHKRNDALVKQQNDKADKYSTKYGKTQKRYEWEKAMKLAENNAIQNMSYKDMIFEKRMRLGTLATTDVLVNIGTHDVKDYMKRYKIAYMPHKMVGMLNTSMRVSGTGVTLKRYEETHHNDWH